MQIAYLRYCIYGLSELTQTNKLARQATIKHNEVKIRKSRK